MKLSCQDWSDAIGRATFSAAHAGRYVNLAIDQEEIGRIGHGFGLDPAGAYESFRDAVIAELKYGWPDPDLPVRDGQFPVYLAPLVAQVVAAFQMHDDGQTGSNAYWRRLREFLCQPSQDAKPEGLKTCRHTKLWKGLKRWANDTNGGDLGRVRLAEKDRGHRLIAEPLGQCLLRRADLTKLRQLFSESGRPGPGSDCGRWLKELVDEARWSLSSRYLTKHTGQILDDPNRFDDAWEQIEAEYRRFLDGESPAAAPVSRRSPSGMGRRRARTTVLLQVSHRGLSGGLYNRGDGSLTRVIADVGEVLRRCYQRTGREGATPPHRPPHDGHLLAVRIDDFGAFLEKPMCRVGDDVLLLVPGDSGQSWLDDADPRLFVESPRRYGPTLGRDRAVWGPLEGLPMGWLALRFRAREDLSGLKLEGRWVGLVDRRSTSLRAEGGLRSRRGTWMLGAGPTVRVFGPGSFDHVLVDGEPRPLDQFRCASPDLGTGEHRVRLPGSGSRSLRILIQAPRRVASGQFEAWHHVDRGWPTSVAERRRFDVESGSGTLRGAWLSGAWPAYREAESMPLPSATSPRTTDDAVAEELAAMSLASRRKSEGRFRHLDPRINASVRAASAPGANPLLLALLRASHPVIPTGTDHA